MVLPWMHLYMLYTQNLGPSGQETMATSATILHSRIGALSDASLTYARGTLGWTTAALRQGDNNRFSGTDWHKLDNGLNSVFRSTNPSNHS